MPAKQNRSLPRDDHDRLIGPFRAQHLSVARAVIATPDGHAEVMIDESESPLAWLARRKGRDGKPLIEGVQFLARRAAAARMAAERSPMRSLRRASR
jgi:hypothetical protein